MDPSRREEMGSAHIAWDSAGNDINELEAYPVIKKILDNQFMGLETVAGKSNLNGTQAIESIYNNRQASYEPLRATKIPYLPSTINDTDLAMARPEFNVSQSGHSSSASLINTIGRPSILYETPVVETDFGSSFRDDPIYYHPSLLQPTRCLGSKDHRLSKLLIGSQASLIHDMNGPPLMPRQQQLISSNPYAPQQQIKKGKLGVFSNQMSKRPSSRIHRPSQEDYGGYGENTASIGSNNASPSDWSPNKFISSLPPPQAYDYPLQGGVKKHGLTTAKGGDDLSLDISRGVQDFYAQDRLRNNTTLSTSICLKNGDLSISKQPKKLQLTSLDLQASPKLQTSRAGLPVSITRQIVGLGVTEEKDVYDLWLEAQEKENEKLYKRILYSDHCKRLAAFFLEVTDERHIDLASGAGIMVRSNGARERDENQLIGLLGELERSPSHVEASSTAILDLTVTEAMMYGPRAEQSSLMPDVRPYLGHQLRNPKSIKVDPNTWTHQRIVQAPNFPMSTTSTLGLSLGMQNLEEVPDSSADGDLGGENELAQISDIEYRKPSAMSLNLPEIRKVQLSAAKYTKKSFAAAKAQKPSTQASNRLPGRPAEQQPSKAAARTTRKRKVLDAQDPGPRNFLEHEYRLLRELHHHLTPGASYPSDRPGWSAFLASNGSAWKTFLGRNETPAETAARVQAIAEHKTAVENFEKGEKARERQAHRQRQDAATAASEAKIKAMTEKNLQKRAENPDVPWRDLRQA